MLLLFAGDDRGGGCGRGRKCQLRGVCWNGLQHCESSDALSSRLENGQTLKNHLPHPQNEMFLFRTLGHRLLRRTRRLWRVKTRKKRWELITTTLLSTPSPEIKIQQRYYQAKVDTKAPLMRETIFTLGNYFILSFYNGTLCCYNSCQYTQDTPNQTCFGVQE